MLAPSIFGMNDLFDDFGDVFEFSPAFRKQVAAARNISSLQLPLNTMQKIKKRTTKKVRRRKPLNISVVKDIMASAREASLLERT